MKKLQIGLLFLLFGIYLQTAFGEAKGTIKGGQLYDIPDWFKVSFLDLKVDSSEAGEKQKGLMLFMHLDGCPYCSRVLDENFRRGNSKQYVEKNFDVIAINIRGGREVTWVDGKVHTEKQVARLLGVHFTPTIVFLDKDTKKILQLNGYRKPETLRYAMQYVREGAYKRTTLSSYVQEKSSKTVYEFIDEPSFTRVKYLAGYKKPLAVIFEDKDCSDCRDFHNKLLTHPDVKKELSKFMVVRLDAYSDHALVDPDGNKTTPRKWVHKLKLDYRPGIILFNEGREQSRIDGRLYHFHFKEALRYVSSGFYREYPTYNAYLAVRQQELLSQGINIDLAE